jgi:hypothetical protein
LARASRMASTRMAPRTLGPPPRSSLICKDMFQQHGRPLYRPAFFMKHLEIATVQPIFIIDCLSPI